MCNLDIKFLSTQLPDNEWLLPICDSSLYLQVRPVTAPGGCETVPGYGTFCGNLRMSEGFFVECVAKGFNAPEGEFHYDNPPELYKQSRF